MTKARDTSNLVSSITGIAVTISGDPVVLGVGSTELVRVTGDGNVGIGTDVPNYRLVVEKQDNAVMLREGTGSLAGMTTNTSQKLWFQGGNAELGLFRDSDGDFQYILGTWQSTTPIPLVFRTANRTERMRITYDGKVGIGTIGSEYALSIREADNNNKFLMLQKNSGQELLQIREDGNNHIIFDGSHASGELHFYTAGNEKLRIKSDGKVGIGTDDPGNVLHVQKNGGDAILELQNSGNGNHSGIFFVRESSGGVNKGAANIYVESNTSASASALVFGCGSNIAATGSERMRLESSGTLGIGTDDNTSMLLTLADGSSSGIFFGNVGVNGYRIRSNISNTANYGIMIEDKDGVDLLRITGNDGSNATSRNTHQLYINGTEHVRLDASGRLNVESVNGTSTAARFGTLDGSNFENLENTLYVYGHSSSDYTLLRGCNTADGTPVFDAQVSGSRFIEIEASGDVNSQGPYTNISDQRLKENIIDSPSQWDDVKALRVRKFNFTEASGYPMNTKIGFIAQEVEQVSPGLVKTRYGYDEEGQEIAGSDMKLVKTSVITTKAFKALQEAMARIEILESRLNSAGIATT